MPRELSQGNPVVLTFEEALNPLTVTAQTVQIQGVASTVALDVARKVITITPQAQLAANTAFTVTVDVEDLAGNLDTFGSIRFTTEP